MPKQFSLADFMHYENRRDYTKHEGNIAYLDGTPLKRPFSMPIGQRIIMVIIIILALGIGAYMVNKYVISHWQEVASDEQAVVDNLSREASIETIPNVATLVQLDNEAIKNTFSEAGYTTYDASKTDDSYDMVLYKLPSDVTIEDAAVMITSGINGLSAKSASKLLNGSWYFAVDRVNGTSMVCRYADFSTDDPQIAVQNALKKEGFDPASASESGVDDSGNTFTSGAMTINDAPYTWKISAIPLDSMYSISGLPKDACYVGIRVTSAQ